MGVWCHSFHPAPCPWCLVSGYLSFIGGQAGQGDRLWRLVLSTMFILGFTLVFVALGAGTTALGQFFRQYQQKAGLAGELMILFGAFMAGFVPMDDELV
ncbi:cytochrome c biogenesis CcdA family protein [Saccharospirillum sp.]|uniref:cytochrome c biogenesis CcdA family protein n=1 Tax=Saccharospirillum sp. TaxID=2033801 RepID=UPI00349FFF7D